MPSKKRWILVCIFLAIVLIAGVATLIIPQLIRSDFRKSLAVQLNVDPEFLHLNIPPAPNRLPGAAFVTRGPVLALVPSLGRDDLTSGNVFQMEWRELGRNDAQSQIGAGLWRGLFSAETNDVYRVRLEDCHILEATPALIRRQLLQSEDVRRQANAGYKPLVIVRSYEGKLELKIERGSKSDAELWAKKVKLAKGASETSIDGKLKVSSEDDQHLVISWDEPVVFAYEAAEARIFADHLGTAPDKIELTPLRSSEATIPSSIPVPTAVDTSDSKKKE
jgi:hypothetical protein